MFPIARREPGNRFVYRIQQQLAIRSEGLHQKTAGACAQVDGERLPLRQLVQNPRELVIEIHLIGHLEVANVDQHDIQDRRQMEEIVIAVDAGRTRRLYRGCTHTGVLFKGSNGLRLFVIEDTKGGSRQAMNRIAIRIRHRDIGEDNTSVGMK